MLSPPLLLGRWWEQNEDAMMIEVVPVHAHLLLRATYSRSFLPPDAGCAMLQACNEQPAHLFVDCGAVYGFWCFVMPAANGCRSTHTWYLCHLMPNVQSCRPVLSNLLIVLWIVVLCMDFGALSCQQPTAAVQRTHGISAT
jgi:hypothetical protein